MCISPIVLKQKERGRSVPVPCGQCVECYKRKVSNWSFRLLQEEKVSQSSYFITLTYTTETIPITKNGFMNLDKTDIQKFFKRLRKHNKNKLKYYAVGEYGTKTMRPHYHIVLFNADIKTIEKAWKLGLVHCGFVSGASVGYVLKYISKKSKIPIHQNDDRQKEFSLMSKGMGKNYLTQAMKNWHREDMLNRLYCTTEQGKKISMPRYYKQKIYEWYELALINEYVSNKRYLENKKTEQERASEINGKIKKHLNSLK